MKTTIAFLLGLLCLFITTFLIIETVESVNNANQSYMGNVTGELYEFKTTFLFTAFILSLLAIATLGHAVYFFKLFYNNYCNIMQKKRDNDIKKHLIDNKYEKLYNDLNNTNIYEEKQKIISKFFNVPSNDRFKEKLINWIDRMRAESVKPDEAYSKEEVINLRKTNKIVPERDTFDEKGI